MAWYVYNGPRSGVTIRGRDYQFFNNTKIELPQESAYVKTLLGLGHLAPLPATEDKTVLKRRKGGENVG